jgi:isopentenyl diphosphate isomerase/L-lactate dehydrogenase-like FMN-dependent dehydrogenase
MPAAMMHGRVWDKLARGDLVRRSLSFSFTYDYLEEVAEGVAEAESINWVGVATGREDLLATEWLRMGMEKGNKTIVIVKPLRYKEKVLQLLRDSEKLGAVAVGMDIDSMFYEKVMDEYEGPKSHGPQSIEDLKEYKETTDLPFIVKGVLSVRDAKICKDEIGADGIVVSTHGGECIDYLVPILKVLPEIRKAVGKDMRIDVDTGFRRGSDVLKALALGADGVCFGQLMVMAFTAYGRLGVTNMLRVLYNELERNMTFTGCKNIGEIDSSILRFS